MHLHTLYVKLEGVM